MSKHTLRRRMSALAAVLGVGIVLPFAGGATPAYAAARLSVTKTHEGNFPRGGQGTYHMTIRNVGDEANTGPVHVTDNLPQGLSFNELRLNPDGGVTTSCPTVEEEGFACDFTFDEGATLNIDFIVDVAPDAPCGSVVNTITASGPADGILTSASDPTTITGPGCNNGDGAGSILPVNLNGVFTAFNNINTNNNVFSPGATNTTNQNLGVNAP
ncbi:hypothetical protein AB0O22_26435 [Streptomyces sp. NPDC091204]|uniref:hypothetical protein n=1 Tax=Streptomyces sp. NPDC091204 TaxID=3155299 RepID=UPI00341BB234